MKKSSNQPDFDLQPGGESKSLSHTNKTETTTVSNEAGGYWVSCRFCSTSLFADQSGIEKIICHEESQHPNEFLNHAGPNFYKIFKLKGMHVDVRPTHPLLKTILKVNSLIQKTARKEKSQVPVTTTAVSPLETEGTDQETIARPRRLSVPPSPSPVLTSSTSLPTTPTDESQKCQVCNVIFKFPSALRAHMKTAPCGSQLANTEGTSSNSNSNNKGSTTKSADHTCPECFKSFLDVENLKKHVLLHTTSRQRGFTCEFCAELRDFRNTILLNDHVRLYHRKDKPYTCVSGCNECFCTVDERNLHIGNTHARHIYQQASSSSSSNNNSSQQQHQLICELCEHVCTDKMELIAHRKIVHKIISAPVSCNTTSDNIQQLCSTVNQHSAQVIGQDYGYWENPAAQMVTVVEDQDDQNYNSPYSTEEQQDLICKMCNESFALKSQLLRHRKKCKSGEFKCEHCSMTFNRNQDKQHHVLKKHRKGTVQPLAFACRICYQPFDSVKQRNSHEKQVGHIPPYFKCHYCDHRFVGQSDRAIHEQRIHTNDLGAMVAKSLAAQELVENTQSQSSRSPTWPPKESVFDDEVIVVQPTDPLEIGEEVEETPVGNITAQVTTDVIGSVQTNNEYDDMNLPKISINVNAVLEENNEIADGGNCENRQGSCSNNSNGHGHGHSSVVSALANKIYSKSPQNDYSFQRLATELTSNPTAFPLRVDYNSDSGDYYCQFCLAPFKSFIDCTIHLDQHCYCATCELQFISIVRFKQHLLSSHDRVGKYYCQICSKDFLFAEMNQLFTHVAVSHATTENININCSKCPQRFSTIGDLGIHFNSAHRDKSFQFSMSANTSSPMRVITLPRHTTNSQPAGATVSSVTNPNYNHPSQTSTSFPQSSLAYIQQSGYNSGSRYPSTTPQQAFNNSPNGIWPKKEYCLICRESFASPPALLRHNIYAHNYSQTGQQINYAPSNKMQYQPQSQGYQAQGSGQSNAGSNMLYNTMASISNINMSVNSGYSGNMIDFGRQPQNQQQQQHFQQTTTQQIQQQSTEQINFQSTEVLLQPQTQQNFIDESVEDECMILEPEQPTNFP